MDAHHKVVPEQNGDQLRPRHERVTLTNAEIQAITGLGRDKVSELLRAGIIPSVRVGRRYLVTRSHLERFLRGEARE